MDRHQCRTMLPTTYFCRSLSLPVIAVCLGPTMSLAQVSHLPQERRVLLEEFTAINCGNCPAGHAVAAALVAAHPDDIVLVNMHAGPLAVPSVGQPDLRSSSATQLLAELGVTFTPQGLVGRRAYNGTTLLSSGAWVGASNAVLSLPAVVNIAIDHQFDADTRVLDVQVELYYTADSPGGNDELFVLLTEDHVHGYQQNYGAGGAIADYDHRHVLRAYLTPLEGDEVITTTAGSSLVRNYAFVLPEAFNSAQCRVVAFVGEGALEGYGEVHQVAASSAIGVSASVGEVVPNLLGRAFPAPAMDIVTIPVHSTGGVTEVLVRDGAGRLVRSIPVTIGASAVVIEVGSLEAGVYFYSTATGVPQRLLVVH